MVCNSAFLFIFSKQTAYRVKMGVFILVLGALLACTWAYPHNNCLSGCQACVIINYHYYCTLCDPDRIYDSDTGNCDCNSTAYDNGVECISCPNSCQTCNPFGCTSCASAMYLDSSGSCQCNSGSTDDQGNCQPSVSVNLGIILGIAAGASLGLSCILSIIYVVRKRNFRLFDRAPTENMRVVVMPRRDEPQPAFLQIARDFEDSSSYNTVLEKKQPKQVEFKQETCSICLDETAYFMTECGHYYHHHCITEWIKKRDHCPNCNQTISPLKIMKWCHLCRKQLIRPQRYRILSSRRMASPQEMPLFWPPCPNCQHMPEQMGFLPLK